MKFMVSPLSQGLVASLAILISARSLMKTFDKGIPSFEAKHRSCTFTLGKPVNAVPLGLLFLVRGNNPKESL